MRFLRRLSIFLMATLFWSADIHAQKTSRSDLKIKRSRAGGVAVEVPSLKQMRLNLRGVFTHAIVADVSYAKEIRQLNRHKGKTKGTYQPIGYKIPQAATTTSAPTDFRFIANIDHDDILIISPTYVQWDHQPGGARPGQHTAISMRHTELNGFRWFPTWPPPAISRLPALSGQLSTNLYAGLVTSGRQVVFKSIVQSNNGGVRIPPRIIQQPTQANSNILKVHFEDKDSNGPELFNVVFGLQ